MKKKKSIVIIGARMDGHAGVIVDVLETIGSYSIKGFIDNTPELVGKKVCGIPVIGTTDDLETMRINADCVHIAIGDNVARGGLYHILHKRKIPVETIIHPTAQVSSKAKIGKGCFVGAYAIVNNGTTISNAAIVNTGAIVEHDNKIGIAVHLAPGTKTAGRVQIDDHTFVGLGSTILPDIHIGGGALIGAGSTVVKDVPDKTTVVGYAARKHLKNIYQETKPDVDTQKIFVTQPTLPDYTRIDEKFRDIVDSLMLSNFSRYVQELEKTVEEKMGVKKALSFPNGTTALMLSLKAMNLKGEVICPRLPFSATGHALVWNGIKPVFADIDLETFNIDPDDIEKKINSQTCAIVAVHIFGNPCEVDRLESIAKKHKLKLMFDSAHALGSTYKGQCVGGFGDVECFSLSGTKVVTSAEGGIATSNDEEFMEKLRVGRNYGSDMDYDCQYIGLNGKMSEFHAAIALESLARLDEFVMQRISLVKVYQEELAPVPGVTFQTLTKDSQSTYKDLGVLIDPNLFGMNRNQLQKALEKDSQSTYKDLGVLIDPNLFGMNRNQLQKALEKEKIYTKTYFYPPLHRMKAYANVPHRSEGLRNTDFVANNIICLPLYSHMEVKTVKRVCDVIKRAQKGALKSSK